MTRRIITRIAAALVAAALTAGCVTQPMDETALTGPDPKLGSTAAPVDESDADAAAKQAKALAKRHAEGAKHKGDGVWTAPRKDRARTGGQGGLVREDAEGSGDGAGDGQRTPSNDDSDDRPSDQQQDDNGGDGGDGGDGGGSGGNDGGGDDTNGGSGDGGDEDDPGPSPQPREPSETAFTAIAGASDASGDPSGASPGYADIRQLLVESNGKRARVTVAVAANIPTALEEGEVQGIGIDFYRSNDDESDYQLFIDGGDDGWRAFLHTPDGVVQYPGSFGVGGRVFVLELPWESLGGRKPAQMNMFIDWSLRGTPLTKSGNDRAPDETRVRVDPR